MSNPGPPPLPGSPSTLPPAPGSQPAKKGLSPWAWAAIGCGGVLVLMVVGMVVLGVSIFNWGRGALEEATGEQSLSDFVEGLEGNPARTLAETAIRMNPDLELLSTDEDAGTITFRNRETGEEATLNFADIAEGRFSMTTSDGDFSVDASEAAPAADGAPAGGVTFSGPDGSSRIGGNISLDELPDWVPVYPGSDDAQVGYLTTTAEGQSGLLTGTTNDTVQQVVERYREAFEGNGFTIATESSNRSGTSQVALISATGEAGTVNVTATKDDGQATNIAVLFGAGDAR